MSRTYAFFPSFELLAVHATQEKPEFAFIVYGRQYLHNCGKCEDINIVSLKWDQEINCSKLLGEITVAAPARAGPNIFYVEYSRKET